MQFYVIAAKLRIILQFVLNMTHKPALLPDANDYTAQSDLALSIALAGIKEER